MPPPSDRRTAVVRFLKIALPLAALALIAAVFAFPRDGFDGAFSTRGISVDLARGLRLDRPRFTGETGEGRRFSVTADWALPDGPDPETVLLGPVRGEIGLDDGRTLRLEAGGGEMRPRVKTLTLDEGVTLETSDGYRLDAASARADLEAEALEAQGPVRGVGALGEIESATMRAARRAEGDYVWFEGGVRVVIRPRAAE